VQGFPWCRKSAKEIGISGLTAKILCKHHNNALSSIDDAGQEFFATLREMRRLANVRAKLKPGPWKVVKYLVDGPPVERWFLKTLINICCDREYPIGSSSTVPGQPSDELVRIAFGRQSFTDLAGLHFVVRTGMQANSTDSVSFSPILKPRMHIEGGVFGFRGLRLLLFLEAAGPPAPLTGLFFEGEDLGDCQLNFHNEQINENSGKYRSQVLRMKW
jgi:hypothetical protein